MLQRQQLAGRRNQWSQGEQSTAALRRSSECAALLQPPPEFVLALAAVAAAQQQVKACDGPRRQPDARRFSRSSGQVGQAGGLPRIRPRMAHVTCLSVIGMRQQNRIDDTLFICSVRMTTPPSMGTTRW